MVTISCNAQYVDSEWLYEIEAYAYEVDLNITAEIVVVVLSSLYGHGITDDAGNEINDIVKLGAQILNEQSLDVYDGSQTGIGKQGKDNGVLVLIAI